MGIQFLNDFFILRIKSIDYRVFISNINKKDAKWILNNSVLSNNGVI